MRIVSKVFVMVLAKLLIICLILEAVFSTPSHLFNLELNDDWLLYKSKFNKTYVSNEDEMSRRLIWEDNVRSIEKHNLEHDLGKHTYTMGINQFSDLTFEEFRLMYLPTKFNISVDKEGQYYMPPLNSDAEVNYVDWRLKGYVTGVKNQGHCGSCWSFSATGSLEGQHYRKYNKLVSLSEQQLVDCSISFGNNGCNGGLMSRAINYVKAAGGIQSEQGYPYQAVRYQCRFNRSRIVATANGYVNIAQSEIALANAVAHIGPISIAIDANHPSFQHYKSGVYYEPSCSTQSLDHAVLIVGYGKDSSNRPYWIVKNSWGPAWGNNGYIYMAKDMNNQCGVATLAGYPLV